MMKGRVKLNNRGQITIVMNWEKLVERPAKEGFWIEAFASADALIDSNIESILRQIYDSSESQHLISQLTSARGQTKFFGLGILTVLKKVGVVNSRLYSKIEKFKNKRNKVSHTIYGEYSLASSIKFKTQKEWDSNVEKEAIESLEAAKEIWLELIEISKRLSKKFQKMNSNEKGWWLIEKEKDF